MDVTLLDPDSATWAADLDRIYTALKASGNSTQLSYLDRMVTSVHCLTARALLQAMRHEPDAASGAVHVGHTRAGKPHQIGVLTASSMHRPLS